METEFVTRLRAGDEQFYAELIREHEALLRARIRRSPADVTAIEDLIQEVWLLVWKERYTFRGGGSANGTTGTQAFRSWLLRLCRTAVSRDVRSRCREPIFSANDDDRPVNAEHDERSPQESRGVHTATDVLWDIILSLPAKRRMVVLYRSVEGLSTAETARILGCRPGTVKAALKAALAQARAKADAASPEPPTLPDAFFDATTDKPIHESWALDLQQQASRAS